ncbi:DNA-protecting protein DprA [Micromonospora sp. NBC_01699]|uniref:DNA-processing protein DprA n=1 Tax=Micromonospora sp. NBC_01699 TaxID=2975984 RepID=UPI002E2CF549|nr:DNA-processing protein DprA [Micromonospora sp. NBC_01699]
MDRASAERAALVALLRQPGVSWSDIALDIQETGSAQALLDRLVSQRESLLPDETSANRMMAAAADDLRAWEAEGTGVHAFFDDPYPRQLRDIREMPPILFTRGTLDADSRAVAVVGSRSASDEGLRIAAAVSTSLARRQVTVVSGLAKGIDTIAHEAALTAGGRTVAVIGTGVRQHYPAANRRLQTHIADVGLVISQFWPDAAPTRQSFPMRNAVMSGYAAATVVIEAGWKSGARIQARLALQHGRPVVLTNQVMQNDWAQAFADNPGVYVVRSLVELLDVVEEILRRTPTAVDLENFPDLATL